MTAHRSRRSLLATAAGLAVAGCLDATNAAAPDGTPPSEQPPSDAPSPDGPATPEGCHSGFHVTAEPFDPAAELPLSLDDAERSLVADAVDGPAEVRTYDADPPVDDGVYVVHDGSYYRTAVEETAETTVTARVLDLEWEAGQEAPAGATTVDYADLPGADRDALDYAVHGPEYGEQRGLPTEGLHVEDSPVPYPDDSEESRLVGAGETWVRWDGRTYRVEVGGEATVTRHTYRVALSEVATNDADFREHVAGEYLVRLDDLSADERAVVEAATQGGYEECEPPSDGFAALRERLEEESRLPHPREASWYVAYDGERYRFDVLNWVH